MAAAQSSFVAAAPALIPVLDPTWAETKHAAWVACKWMAAGVGAWSAWRWIIQPWFDVQVDASHGRQMERFTGRVQGVLDADTARTDARMLASVQRNAPAWADKLEKYVYADHIETRGAMEAKLEGLIGATGGNTRSLTAMQGELDAHSRQIRDVPDMSRALVHLTETMTKIDAAQVKRDERQQEYALRISTELGRLSGVVERLAREWDGRERRDPSAANQRQRDHFNDG